MRAQGDAIGTEPSAEAIEQLLDRSPLGAVITSNRSFRVSYVNPPLVALAGRPASALSGLGLAELPIRRGDRRRLELLLEQGQGALAGLFLRLENGRIARFDVTVQPLPGDGQPRLLWWVTDTTEQHRTAHQLAVAKAAAEAAARDRARLMATMSREIRGPVSGLLEGARRLLETSLDGQQHDLAEEMRYGAEALLALLADLRDVSALDSGAMPITHGGFDLRRLVDSILTLVLPRAREKGLDCRIAISPDVPRRLIGDMDRLRQILWNLLANAVRFTERGEISVTVAGAPDSEGWRLRFTIADTGPGISEPLRSRLFHQAAPAVPPEGEMGRREGPHPGSTGLGLLLCKKIVDLWGGAIGVESQPGQGATFWVELPFEAARIEQIALRLLVAEDNPVNQKIISGLLTRHGHRVEVVGDGRQAVLAAMARPFDAVLMDMEMPVLDGLAATEAIRALPGAAGRMPIIALTANGQPGDEERCLSAGMNDYVSKPILPERLFAALLRQTGAPAPCAALPPPVQPLDRGQIAELEKIIGRSPTVELLALFITDARDRCHALLALRQDQPPDILRMRELAHDLKSTAGNFGFASLSRLAAAIEQACRDDRRDEALTLLDHLQTRWTEALAAAYRLVPELAQTAATG